MAFIENEGFASSSLVENSAEKTEPVMEIERIDEKKKAQQANEIELVDNKYEAKPVIEMKKNAAFSNKVICQGCKGKFSNLIQHLNRTTCKKFYDLAQLKVDAIEKKLDIYKEEVNHLINKTNDDLNRAIESNLEDTTQAVVKLRKDFLSQINNESETREKLEQDIRSNLADSVEKFSKHIEQLEGEGRQIQENTQKEFELVKGEIKEYQNKTDFNFVEIGEKSNENNKNINDQITALGK